MTRHIYHSPWLTHWFVMLPVKKDEWRKEKEADLFYLGWRTGISWCGVSLTEHYSLRNINAFLNLNLQQFYFYLCLSFLYLWHMYLWHFCEELILLVHWQSIWNKWNQIYKWCFRCFYFLGYLLVNARFTSTHHEVSCKLSKGLCFLLFLFFPSCIEIPDLFSPLYEIAVPL